MLKKILIVIVALTMFPAALHAKDFEIKKTMGELAVLIKMDRNPPIAGENTLVIELTDKAGAYITDATVAVNYTMPPMPGMPAMSDKVTLVQKENGYMGKVDLSMAGSWNFIAKITRTDKTETLRFTVDAH